MNPRATSRPRRDLVFEIYRAKMQAEVQNWNAIETHCRLSTLSIDQKEKIKMPLSINNPLSSCRLRESRTHTTSHWGNSKPNTGNARLIVSARRDSGDRPYDGKNARRSGKGESYTNKNRRRGRPAWQRSPDDTPLRDGNRDRLMGLLTERFVLMCDIAG